MEELHHLLLYLQPEWFFSVHLFLCYHIPRRWHWHLHQPEIKNIWTESGYQGQIHKSLHKTMFSTNNLLQEELGAYFFTTCVTTIPYKFIYPDLLLNKNDLLSHSELINWKMNSWMMMYLISLLGSTDEEVLGCSFDFLWWAQIIVRQSPFKNVWCNELQTQFPEKVSWVHTPRL